VLFRSIPGATATSLTITNVQEEDAGNYQVVVTDGIHSTGGSLNTGLIQMTTNQVISIGISNMISLRTAEIDATPDRDRMSLIFRGLYAGNQFDMGSRAVVEAFEKLKLKWPKPKEDLSKIKIV